MIPLLEIAEHTDYVRLAELDLPGAPLDRVNVDLTRLERVMHWGGVRVLTLGSFEGEGTEYTATNFTINPDGTMGATKSKIAAKAKIAAPVSEDMHKNPDYRWRNTAVYFNSTGLKEQEPDPKSQVKTMDHGLRTNLLEDMAQHELSTQNLAKEVAFAASIVGIIKLLPYSDMDWSQIIHFSMPKYYWPAVLKFWDTSDRHIRNIDRGMPPKYSTMYYWRVDRVMLASRHLTRRILTLGNEVPEQE